MAIGKMIVKLRKEKRMSQEKLAELLGISRQTLSNYENDITSPDLLQAKKICEIFDISLDLLTDNDTISSRISSTERLVKKQNRDMKIILVTLYATSVIYLYNLLICKGTKSQLESREQKVFRK